MKHETGTQNTKHEITRQPERADGDKKKLPAEPIRGGSGAHFQPDALALGRYQPPLGKRHTAEADCGVMRK
jgi:hypothetical protein